MIRREHGDHWWLLTQAAHAQLACRFAEALQFDEQMGALNRELLQQTIAHHDDGWTAADATPVWGQEHARPLDFLDATPEVSIPAWEQSIETCAAMDPQAGFWVSRHFTALGMSVFQGDDHTDSQMELMREFIHEQSELQTELIQLIIPSRCVETQQAVNETGYGLLRSFDHLSLILTVARQSEPVTWPLTGYHKVRLMPIQSDAVNCFRFAAEPWPFGQKEKVCATATGLLIPRSVNGQHELDHANRQNNTLELEFVVQRG